MSTTRAQKRLRDYFEAEGEFNQNDNPINGTTDNTGKNQLICVNIHSKKKNVETIFRRICCEKSEV